MSRAGAPGAEVGRFLAACRGRRVLVLGDLMVDRYYAGSVRRISPEAPVPVVDVSREIQRLGGAANVANNVRALGGEVDVGGVVGDDAEGAWLRSELRAAGIGDGGVVVDPDRPTTLKCRVVAHQQQVVRFDRERTGPHGTAVGRALAGQVRRLWEAADAVVVSDYGKGLVDGRLMSLLRRLGRGPSRPPVAIDPKSPLFERYRGATVITPNLQEALAAAGPEAATGLDRAGAALVRRSRGSAVLVTRGEAGMVLFRPRSAPLEIPTLAREVYDVTGAGDTVVAVVALGLAAGMALPEAAAVANRAAGVVVGEFGTVPVTRRQLRRAGGRGRAVP